MIGKFAVYPRMMATLRAIMTVGAIMAVLRAELAQAQIPVSIELVLAVDVSRSVDDVEYDLQMAGIARAFRNREIIDLIGQHDGVAVALFQWDESADKQHMIPWQLLRGSASVLSFADKVQALERSPSRKNTGIGKAIEFGVRLISENEFSGRQLKIDISGDGWDNIGSLTSASRQEARSLGIGINGLPILTDTVNLDMYYREKVILGPDAFLEVATDYDDFARAFLRKLRREITPFMSRNDPAPHAPVQQAHESNLTHLDATRDRPASHLHGTWRAKTVRAGQLSMTDTGGDLDRPIDHVLHCDRLAQWNPNLAADSHIEHGPQYGGWPRRPDPPVMDVNVGRVAHRTAPCSRYRAAAAGRFSAADP
jgi:hypothetical protein